MFLRVNRNPIINLLSSSNRFCFSVVLFELAKLQPPFCNKHIYQLAQEVLYRSVLGLCVRIHTALHIYIYIYSRMFQVTNAPVPSVRKHYSVDLDNMVFTLLQKQPQRRPSATKVHRIK